MPTIITVHRQKRVAEGWIDVTPLTLHEPPELAHQYARSRSGGPLAPTEREIILACEIAYENASTSRAQMGDAVVTRVEIFRA